MCGTAALLHRMPRFRAYRFSPATRIGESSMPRQSKPARRCAPHQVDLFAAEPQTTTGGMPAWSGLATEIQAALTNLMTRLILQHAEKIRIASITRAWQEHAEGTP